MMLRAERSVLVVVDVQDRLAPAMQARDSALHNIHVLMRAAARLDVPLIVTEHYPKGIGPTLSSVAALAPGEAIVEKITFAASGSEAFNRRLAETGRSEPVICGFEAHVCVLQTALGLKMRGFKTWLAADATSSRRAANAEAAIERCARNGVETVTTEMVVFEWLRRADCPHFRDLIALVKQPAPGTPSMAEDP